MFLVVTLMGTGCGGNGAESSAPPAPISGKLREAVPELRGKRYFPLLSFESESDTAFINPSDRAVLDGSVSHTGNHSLRINPGGTAVVRLLPLLPGSRLDAEWSILSIWGLAPAGASGEIVLSAADRPITRREIAGPMETWTALPLDLHAVPLELREAGELSLVIRATGTSGVWVDDLMVVNNREELYRGAQGWSVRREGLKYVCEAPESFRIELATMDGSPKGWVLEESNGLRARFASRAGGVWTLYRDGRSFVDGKYSPVSAAAREMPGLIEAHAMPAEVVVPEDQGRLNRRSAGDRDNDGYDESRGTYRILAKMDRLDVHIKPRGTAVVRPILEVEGLPPGELVVTLEGKLVGEAQELKPPGSWLIELPVRIERPVAVSIRVRPGTVR